MRTLGSVLLMVCVVTGCQKADPPAAPPLLPVPAAAPAPAPPPQTSLGKLVNVATAQTYKARVQYLTVNGLKSGTDELTAEKGKTFVVLTFEDKPAAPKKKETGMVKLGSGGSGGRLEARDTADTGEPNVWLTDATGAKYTEWSALFEKNAGTIAFEVPEGATGFVLHDGNDRPYAISPKR